MDSPKSPPGSVRRHGRNISQPLLRRSTKGPLDAVDDPLANAKSTPPMASPVEQAPSTISADSTLTEAAIPQRAKPNVDIRFLQAPNLYQPIPTDDVAPPFLLAKHQPPSDTPLSNLIQSGHFRRAAGVAAQQILQCTAEDAELAFQLLYTRFACLILISRPDLAAQEAVPLLDILARSPPGAEDLVAVMPWELRLLLIRLQSFTAADGGRRGVMALYALAGECRARVKEARASDESAEVESWVQRLRDLGLRVVDALVEMGELETATRHLDSLSDADANEVAYRKTLLRTRVGDMQSARDCLGGVHNASRKAALTVLMEMADGKEATRSWESLMNTESDHPAYANNLAVAMVYADRVVEARDLLETAVAASPAFAGVLFNIGTIYELCSDRAVDHKAALARKVAEKEPVPASGGWERSTYDFKL
ncbi:hypothetical protein LTR78_007130 [Recurvomyces mirabilis]|uniref:Uncharacterized protein n=1 Tax=Recurvomyces mirabilis TaxID=574656 RepID=A0AAE0WJT5_9PEZI|nr:hypothetical protein LTR78_007130 [Recurvomyces mirabilis]KAK5150898.1 hypothetical protein LTS14_009701 [Recurvomyces mirabilis]